MLCKDTYFQINSQGHDHNDDDDHHDHNDDDVDDHDDDHEHDHDDVDDKIGGGLCPLGIGSKLVGYE